MLYINKTVGINLTLVCFRAFTEKVCYFFCCLKKRKKCVRKEVLNEGLRNYNYKCDKKLNTV